MNGMIAVDERNQDDMPHKAGCYFYAGTRLWLDDNTVHRSDGPAVIFPDGAGRWYIRGKEMTRSVRNYFFPEQMANRTRPRHTGKASAIFLALPEIGQP